MTAPLKPCPFCGETKIDGGYNDHGGFVSICANCDAFGPPASEMSKEAIVSAWNTRADAPELVALVAAAKDALALLNTDFAECASAGPERLKLTAAIAAYEGMGK